MEGWEFPVLQGIWQGFLWFLRVLPFIVAAAVVIAIWRQYLKTRNIKVAKHLLEIKSTNIIDINRVISELNDFSSMSKKLGHHDETIDTLIQKLRQLRDNPPSAKSESETVKADIGGKIFCPKCGKENPTTISICINCGTKLPKEYLESQAKSTIKLGQKIGLKEKGRMILLSKSIMSSWFPTTIIKQTKTERIVFWTIVSVGLIVALILILRME